MKTTTNATYKVAENEIIKAKKLCNFQKRRGGVIKIPNNEEIKIIFRNLGYKIKHVNSMNIETDRKIAKDIQNHNKKVDYVVCIVPDGFHVDKMST